MELNTGLVVYHTERVRERKLTGLFFFKKKDTIAALLREREREIFRFEGVKGWLEA